MNHHVCKRVCGEADTGNMLSMYLQVSFALGKFLMCLCVSIWKFKENENIFDGIGLILEFPTSFETEEKSSN